MWYRGTNPNSGNERTAKPWHWPLHKKRKRKTKQFDFPESDGFPGQENTDFLKNPVKTPVNTVETPDLPAGVNVPPVQLPHLPSPTLTPEPIEKEIVRPKHKPRELEDLYGPDHDIKDDQIINKPTSPKDIRDVIEKEEPRPNLEKPESEIEPDIPEEPIEEEEPEVPEEKPVDQSAQPVPDPPIHEFCHCKIITMPGGRRIWRTSSESCDQCNQARDTFNQWQATLFGA